jgi:hypothetical protein
MIWNSPTIYEEVIFIDCQYCFIILLSKKCLHNDATSFNLVIWIFIANETKYECSIMKTKLEPETWHWCSGSKEHEYVACI